MAFLTLNYKSKSLQKDTNMHIILPDNTKAPYKTLYLLHGLSDDYTSWTRKSLIERYANSRHIAVFMPDADRSFYSDMKYGNNYFTYISEELIEYTRMLFPLSLNREDTFIAGLSMGGYGALKIALRKPETFSAVASLSGCLDIEDVVSTKGSENLSFSIVGDCRDLSESNENVIYLAKKLTESDGPKPRIYQAIGLEDFLYGENQTFKNAIEPIWDGYVYEEGHGSHTWEFWNKYIKKAIDFFLEKNK